MGVQVGIDVGGTFTDFVVFERGSQRLEFFKLPTTHPPEEGVLNGLREIEARLGIARQDVERIVHGTTVATNALLEHRWAKTALITTAGFRDVLEIGRQNRAALYDFHVTRPEPLVPRRLRFEILERVDAQGRVVRELDESRVRGLISHLREVESIAICFLFSYLHPAHEQRVRELLQQELKPPITLSCEVLPEYREYERTSTTVMSAALRPIVGVYLEQLAKQILTLGISAPLEIMQSNGGLVSAQIAARHAERLLYSGPAGGAAGAQFLVQRAGFENVITLDMGGTSCDVSLITGGRVAQRVESTLAGYRVRVPMVNVHSIGAGGGSIAWIDTGGALRVGPQSAGSDPGPACYGLGEEPTVTDAHLLLGRLDPERALGGRQLQIRRARQVLQQKIAAPLKMRVEEAALGVLEIADAHMERAVRVITVERGYDPREYVLLAFGGAGPLHAATLAQRLGIRKVLIPATAGVLSALGMISADHRQDRVQSLLHLTTDVEPSDLRQLVARLTRAAEQSLRASLATEEIEHRSWVELRYRGQAYELALELPATLPRRVFTHADLREVERRFHSEHERLYGYALGGHPVEMVNVRVETTAKMVKPELPKLERSRGGYPQERIRRLVYFAGEGAVECPIFLRESLTANLELKGPLILEGRESTVLLPSGWRAQVDTWGNLILER
jgi:N-methylhydantoinase A